MKKKLKTFLLTIFFFFLTLLLLVFPTESLSYSFIGLQLWFNRMIPTLLPFMILTGIMIRLNLTESFVRALSPVLKPLLSISLNGIYALVIGFLCGFPMGAKVIADLLSRGKLSQKEAQFLLSFCNNIGPIYFMSFALPVLGLQKKAPYLFGMYGLPLLYGIILRHTLYKNMTPVEERRRPPSGSRQTSFKTPLMVLSAAESKQTDTLLDALDDSIMSSLYGISKLGGYMVLFNLLNLIPQFFLYNKYLYGIHICALLNCLLEITSGISRMGNCAPLVVLLLLPFGGFSCIAQTYSMIKDTALSLKSYVLHKLALSAVTALYYGIWLLFSPSTFLL
ncbi:nucleoside recognition domain-containing protein [Kineothrix alysoides]|nr:nucleoside recognition domain-containing protein [Kineothrix alysoides]